MTDSSVTSLSVVVVDDSEDNAVLLGALLEDFGHRVRIAYDGAQSLELLEQELPDVVLLDLGLPDMDGFEVAETMRARFGGSVRIIAVTGSSGASERRRAEEAGFDAFLTKPFRAAQVRKLLAPPS